MLNNYEKAIELIKEYSNLLNSEFDSTAQTTIKEAEKILKVKFPKVYISFLEDIGELFFGYARILGVLFNNLSMSDMINWTLDERNNWGMPKNLVIIEDEGLDGESYCLQINEENPDKSSVVAYIHPDVPIEILAPDFGTYLLQRVQWAIQVHKEDLEEEKQKEIAQEQQEKMIQSELF